MTRTDERVERFAAEVLGGNGLGLVDAERIPWLTVHTCYRTLSCGLSGARFQRAVRHDGTLETCPTVCATATIPRHQEAAS